MHGKRLPVNTPPQLVEVFREAIEAKDKAGRDMARFIHGEVFSILAVLKMQLELREYNAKRKRRALLLEKEMETTNQIATDLRKVYDELYPANLSRFGLLQTLEEHVCMRTIDEPECQIIFKNSCKSDVRLPEESALHVFRISEKVLQMLLPAKVIEVAVYSRRKELHWILCGKKDRLKKTGLRLTRKSGTAE